MLSKQQKRRKGILTALFVAVNVLIIAVTAVNEFGNSETAAELSEVKLSWWMLIPATLCFMLAIFANVSKYVLLIRESSRVKIKWRENWKLSWRTLMLGRYYDSVTPGSIGGQPFQIYFMRKHSDLEAGHATSIPIFAMIASQTGFLIVAFCCFVSGEVFRENPALLLTSVLGLIFYAFWPVMVAGTIFFPKATSRFLQFGVKVLARVRIVKHRTKTLQKIENEVADYAKSVRMFLKNKWLSVAIISLSVVYNVAIVVIPYFVLKTFGGDMEFFRCVATTVAVTAAVYFVPTPGNAGAAEGTFYAVFSSLSTGYVFWAMLVWRLYTYYSYIIIGPLIYLKMHMESRAHKNKKGVV